MTVPADTRPDDGSTFIDPVLAPLDEVLPIIDADADGNPLEMLHERAYVVHAYRRGPTEMFLRGAVRDDKPAGLYITDDEQPLVIHHMLVELGVSMPDLTITSAQVSFRTNPHSVCPTIASTYEQLVGLSIARGFTHQVRQLFGGPRGCTHTTALLQAMGPVAIQTMWSFRMAAERDHRTGKQELTADAQRAALERSVRTSMNTCHVWDEDGEHVAMIRRGERPEPPLFITKRLNDLGRDPSTWRITIE